MKVYLAGPMRGLPDWNYLAFDKAEIAWRDAGHHVFNPARLARALGYDFSSCGGMADRPHLQHVMISDVACLYAAEAIALLPGWELSEGATVELALAQFLNLLVYDAVTLVQIHPPKCPWGVTSAKVPGFDERWYESKRRNQLPQDEIDRRREREQEAKGLIKCYACEGTGFHRYPDFPDGTPNYSDSAACGTCKGKAWIHPKQSSR